MRRYLYDDGILPAIIPLSDLPFSRESLLIDNAIDVLIEPPVVSAREQRLRSKLVRNLMPDGSQLTIIN